MFAKQTSPWGSGIYLLSFYNLVFWVCQLPLVNNIKLYFVYTSTLDNHTSFAYRSIYRFFLGVNKLFEKQRRSFKKTLYPKFNIYIALNYFFDTLFLKYSGHAFIKRTVKFLEIIFRSVPMFIIMIFFG